MALAIKIENLSKRYRLGVVSASTLKDDLHRFWWKLKGKGDPLLKINEENKLDDSTNKGYVWALRDINLEIEQGEVLGIIGKNGAGKSTLLKILSRITTPTTGIVKIRGRLSSLLEVGTGFHPELTGRENIYLNGTILGMTRKEIDRKFDDIVDFAGIAKYIDTPVKRYSSGMYVRLGFAVAAFLEPDILVVDEVLAVGDAEFQKRAIGKMQEVSRGQGRTVLFVSHNMASIQKLCTKAIVLEKGKIIMHGAVDKCVAYYLEHSSFEHNKFQPITTKGKELQINSIKIYPVKEGFNQPIIFEFDLKANLKGKYRFGFGLNNYLGARILTAVGYYTVKKDYEKIKFELSQHHLSPGKYHIDFGIDYGERTLIYKENVLSMEISLINIDNIFLSRGNRIGAYYELKTLEI